MPRRRVNDRSISSSPIHKVYILMTTELQPPQPPSPSAPDLAPAGRTRCGWIILRKEFYEIFRDRRTVMSVVISPLLITPALFALMGVLINTQTEKARTQVYHVGVVGSET